MAEEWELLQSPFVFLVLTIIIDNELDGNYNERKSYLSVLLLSVGPPGDWLGSCSPGMYTENLGSSVLAYRAYAVEAELAVSLRI